MFDLQKYFLIHTNIVKKNILKTFYKVIKYSP